MSELGLWERLRRDTPPFFKRVRLFGASLVAFSGAIAAVPGMHKVVVELSGYLATFGGSIAALAQFACTNTSTDSPEPTDNP